MCNLKAFVSGRAAAVAPWSRFFFACNFKSGPLLEFFKLTHSVKFMCRGRGRRVPWRLAPVVAVLAVLICAVPGTGHGQQEDQDDQDDRPIFRRFAMKREDPSDWQALFEIPFLLRPQSQADADIERNMGLNYVTSFRPDRKWYMSRSVGFARMEWVPKDSSVARVKVRTFDVTFIVNNLAGGWFVTSFGLGLGVMDGLVKFKDSRNFNERLELFIPIQFGLAIRLGDTLQLGLKISQSTFFRSNPPISTTRLLFGVGFNY